MISEILTRARALIATEDTWIQGAYCRDDCYCLAGAVIQASDEMGGKTGAVLEALRDRLEAWGLPRNIPGFNDRARHVDVLLLLDEAIKHEKQ